LIMMAVVVVRPAVNPGGQRKADLEIAAPNPFSDCMTT
jgi:hypothetical protein